MTLKNVVSTTRSVTARRRKSLTTCWWLYSPPLGLALDHLLSVRKAKDEIIQHLFRIGALSRAPPTFASVIDEKRKAIRTYWWLFSPPVGIAADHLVCMRRIAVARAVAGIVIPPPPDFLIRAEEAAYPNGRVLESYGIDLGLKVAVLPGRKGCPPRRISIPNPSVSIVELSDGRMIYRLDEPDLSDDERAFYHGALRKLMEKYVEEKDMGKVYTALVEAWMKGAKSRARKGWTGDHVKKAWRSAQRILYHLARDTSPYAYLLPLIRDPNIEDISLSCPGKAIYVVLRRYGIHIPTNVVLTSEGEVRKLIRKLIFESGKHISYSTPHQEARMPDGSRLTASFGTEITPMGSTFSIRKFRRFPFSPVELIHLGTMDLDIATYLWFCVEHRKPTLIYGVTGAGKSSLLNSIASFLPFGEKIVTIESRQELNIPYPHLISRVARESYTATGRSYSLEELLAESLWELPTIIIVGEIRRGEAMTYFHALSSGHGGACTIHAGSFDELVNRLLAPPCDVPLFWIPCTKVFVKIKRFKEEPFPLRRIVSIDEPDGEVDPERRYVGRVNIFKWDARKGEWVSRLESSPVVREICSDLGITPKDFMKEFEGRRGFLADLLAVYESQLEARRPIRIEEFYKKISLYKVKVVAG